MSISMRLLPFVLATCLMTSCSGTGKAGVRAEIQTTEGNILIELSDLTPGHRDNFIKLAESGFYDGVSFHRVIQNFMIQTGDGMTKTDTSSLPADYTIPPEFNDSLYHRRGAVAAARMGDDVNPERNSSGTQFYIVQGKVYNDEDLAKAEQRNDYNRRQYLYNQILAAERSKGTSDSTALPDDVIQQTAIMKVYDTLQVMGPYKTPANRRKVYQTEGGTPFLDGAYTVFGQVLEGMDVVDKIAASATDLNDKPVEDIRIIKIKIIR